MPVHLSIKFHVDGRREIIRRDGTSDPTPSGLFVRDTFNRWHEYSASPDPIGESFTTIPALLDALESHFNSKR
jgi:hypothetical protein